MSGLRFGYRWHVHLTASRSDQFVYVRHLSNKTPHRTTKTGLHMGKNKKYTVPDESHLSLPAHSSAGTTPIIDTHMHLLTTFSAYKNKYPAGRYDTVWDFVRGAYGGRNVKAIVDVWCEPPVQRAWKEVADSALSLQDRATKWGGIEYWFVMGKSPRLRRRDVLSTGFVVSSNRCSSVRRFSYLVLMDACNRVHPFVSVTMHGCTTTWSNNRCKSVFGFSRHDASRYYSLEAMTHPRCVGWGEIGLDYHYDNSPRELQQRVFARQLRQAVKLGKPLTIHTREAEQDTERILKQEVPTDYKVAFPFPAPGAPTLMSRLFL